MLVAQMVKNLPAMRETGFSPWIGEENGNPLQYPCLENPMDRGAWRATVHVVAESRTQLKWLNTHNKSEGRNSNASIEDFTIDRLSR